MDLIRRLSGNDHNRQLLRQLKWNLTQSNLNTALINGHELTPEDVKLLETPIPLQTQSLILNLKPSKKENPVPVEFETDKAVTPFDILGAIHTYYSEDDRIDGLEDLLVVNGIQREANGSFTPNLRSFHPNMEDIQQTLKQYGFTTQQTGKNPIPSIYTGPMYYQAHRHSVL